jgi:Phage lysozyme
MMTGREEWFGSPNSAAPPECHGGEFYTLLVIVDKHSRMDKRSAKALKIAVRIPGTLALHQDDLERNAPPACRLRNPSRPLFQGQFDAVVSWIYNLEDGALQGTTMLKKINAARHEVVPGQMKRWTRAAGKVLKGLERRREAEAALYEMRWY